MICVNVLVLMIVRDKIIVRSYKRRIFRFPNHKYHDLKCKIVKSEQDCIRESEINKTIDYDFLFPMIPDSSVKNTDCRERTRDEKKTICDSTSNRIWWTDPDIIQNFKCRFIIEKPKLELVSVTFDKATFLLIIQ